MHCIDRAAASYPGKQVETDAPVYSSLDRTTDCLKGNQGAMTEVQKPVDEANQPNVVEDAMLEAEPVTVETGATPTEVTLDAAVIPELVDDAADIALDSVIDDTAAAIPTTTTASGSDDDTDYEAAFVDLRSTYAAKERECEALKVEAEDRQGQYLRMAADFENFRRRSQKEKEELEVHVKCTTINELLSVVDNFERARSQIKPQNDGEMALHKSYQGVYKDLVDRLKKVGVSPMRAEGQPFDPNFHNAVMREPTAEHPDGTVIEELMRGYLLGDKVLRHAMVKVATPPEDGDASGDAPAE
jgi:molecular chaperone GrpE